MIEDEKPVELKDLYPHAIKVLDLLNVRNWRWFGHYIVMSIHELFIQETRIENQRADVIAFKCPVCGINDVIIYFLDDNRVENCNGEEINPEFTSICRECFNPGGLYEFLYDDNDDDDEDDQD